MCVNDPQCVPFSSFSSSLSGLTVWIPQCRTQNVGDSDLNVPCHVGPFRLPCGPLISGKRLWPLSLTLKKRKSVDSPCLRRNDQSILQLACVCSAFHFAQWRFSQNSPSLDGGHQIINKKNLYLGGNHYILSKEKKLNHEHMISVMRMSILSLHFSTFFCVFFLL